jgi:hypothetical protein
MAYKDSATYLGPNLQHIFKCHARVCELVLQQHDDIVAVLLNLLPLSRLGTTLRFTLLHIRLERSNLLVDVCNILLDDESKFLKFFIRGLAGHGIGTDATYADLNRSVVKKRFTLCHYESSIVSGSLI